MKILKINPDNPEKEKIQVAIDILKNGGTVVYPTDTVYGIGANIFDKEAVQKVYKVKKRSLLKPISACVSKIQDIHKIAYMDKDIEDMVLKGLESKNQQIKNESLRLRKMGETIGTDG